MRSRARSRRRSSSGSWPKGGRPFSSPGTLLAADWVRARFKIASGYSGAGLAAMDQPTPRRRRAGTCSDCAKGTRPIPIPYRFVRSSVDEPGSDDPGRRRARWPAHGSVTDSGICRHEGSIRRGHDPRQDRFRTCRCRPRRCFGCPSGRRRQAFAAHHPLISERVPLPTDADSASGQGRWQSGRGRQRARTRSCPWRSLFRRRHVAESGQTAFCA